MTTEIAGDVSGITEAVATDHHHSEWLQRLQGDVSGITEVVATVTITRSDYIDCRETSAA